MSERASVIEFRRHAASELEGAFVREVEFLGEWVYLHLAFRGTDDGAAVVRVPLDARHGPLSRHQPAPGIYFVSEPCEACRGTGEWPPDGTCPSCGGTGMVG